MAVRTAQVLVLAMALAPSGICCRELLYSRMPFEKPLKLGTHSSAASNIMPAFPYSHATACSR